MIENMLNFEYKSGKRIIFPDHEFVKNWLFKDAEEDEAELAYTMAKIAQKNGLSKNDLHQIFPVVLRILKSNIEWAKA